MVAGVSSRVTICAIFLGCVLARISILPKISMVWLCLRVQTDRCMTSKYHTDGSLCFQNTLEVLWCTNRSEPHLICTCIYIALTVDPTFYNACMLLVKLLFDHYLQQVWKQENKAKTNPGKDVSGENGTYCHPSSRHSVVVQSKDAVRS